MRHAVLLGGKRMRPLLVYAAGTAFGADEASLDAPAAAVELIHAYSLVHDDLPAMDDDDLRRGRATTHIAFDEATAILAGDALQTRAFELLASTSLPPALTLDCLRTLASASGVAGMLAPSATALTSLRMSFAAWSASSSFCVAHGSATSTGTSHNEPSEDTCAPLRRSA